MADQKLAISLSLDAEGLVQGLTVASKGVDGATQSIRQSFANMKFAAVDTGSSISNLGDLIRNKGAMMRSEGRFANFIARDIEGMGIMSKEVAGDIGGLLSSFAIGGGFGLAAESVKLIGKAFLQSDTEVATFTKTISELATKMNAQADAVISGIQKQTQATKFFHDEMVPSLKAETDLKQKLLTANRELTDAQEASSAADKSGVMEEIQGATLTLAAKERNVKALNDELAAQKALSSATGGRVKQIGGAEQLEEIKKIHEGEIQSAAQTNLKLLQDRVALESGEYKLDAENAVKIVELRTNGAQKIRQMEEEQRHLEGDAQKAMGEAIAKARIDQEQLVYGQSQVYVREIVKFRNDAEAKWLVDLTKWKGENLALEAKAFEAVKRLHAEQDNQRAEIGRLEGVVADRQMREQIEAFKQETQAAKAFGEQLGQTFTGLATGTESFAKAFADMAGAGVKAFVDLEMKAIETAAITQAKNAARATSDVTANAADAASGAAASQAGIPIVGPVLAIAAMAATEAAVLGLLSMIPKASGGFDVPMGISPVTQLHGGEMVLPRKHADTIRDLGDGAGGGDVHVHVTAMDAQSFGQWLGSPKNQQQIANLVRIGAWRG